MINEIFIDQIIPMIAGSYQKIEVNLMDILGLPIENLSIDSVIWKAAKFGESESLISKLMSSGDIAIEDNIISVTLRKPDTVNLYGEFVHQVTIIDGRGNEFPVDLGRLLIKQAIK